MRVGLIADIHGNLPALDAVLAELGRERVDHLVCLGDVAVGPQPGETLDRIAALECPVLMGNWDEWFLDGFPEPENDIERKLIEMGAWWADRLSPEQRRYMRSFRPTYELALDDESSLLCFHASPRSNEDPIFATTPEEELDRMLAGARATVLAGGHTHFPFARRHRGSLFVNPGSVGLPFRHEPGPIRIARWAEYGLLRAEDALLAVELRRTHYDVDAYLQAALTSGVPHADWWVGCWAD